MNTSIDPAYLTVEEARSFLRTSRRYLYHLIRHGEIETIKRGFRRLIVLESLRAYAAQERIEKSA